jgi:hypothetical protein
MIMCIFFIVDTWCLELVTLSNNFFIDYHILDSSVYLNVLYSNTSIISNPNHGHCHFKFMLSCLLRRACLNFTVFKTWHFRLSKLHHNRICYSVSDEVISHFKQEYITTRKSWADKIFTSLICTNISIIVILDETVTLDKQSLNQFSLDDNDTLYVLSQKHTQDLLKNSTKT